MNPKYPLIAAAVAAAVGSSYANAAVPTLTQAAAPTVSLVMAGSSAAESSVANALAADLCGGSGNMLTIQSAGGSKNFYAFSCFSTPTNITGIPSNTLTTVYYRTEGGSVVGALPIIPPGHNILRLNLSDSSCSASNNSGTCTVSGVTSTNGPNDSWTGAVVEDAVQLGVTDVEPGKLTGADYPSNYSAAVFGSAAANQAALPGLAHVPAVQQVFGIAVNTSGLTLAKAGTVNLTKEAVANIFTFKYTDWSSVPDAVTGAPVSSAHAIAHVDREPGSGTRTSANIYFLNYPCAGTTAIQSQAGETLNYSTGDDLTLANATPGSITYASIDNLLPPKNTSYTNLVLATINGITPTTLAAATGEYDYWFEATLVPNSATTGTSANLSTWLQGDLPKLSAAPLVPDVNVIPNVAGNSATVGLTSRVGTVATVYINPYTRSGNSCSVPAETN
jgi:hypothetical protein